MSSLPLLLSMIGGLDRDVDYYPSYLGSDFGLGLQPHHIHHHGAAAHHHRRHHEPAASLASCTLPLIALQRLGDRQLARRAGAGADDSDKKISPVGKDGFQVCMDVAHFKPNELQVKVVDNSIVVEGQHEEREDEHGYIRRHFVRRYALPKDYDSEKVQSTLSSDGVLTVSIPKPQLEDKTGERIVQIQQTGPAHLNVKQNTEEKAIDANGAAGDSNEK